MKPLVETNWLFDNLDKVRIFDATWHLPNSKRNAEDEFKKGHIKGSLFFDIDKHSNKNSKLPHMMPDKEQWENIISNFGVKKSDHIIIYDNSDLYSSCRDTLNILNDQIVPGTVLTFDEIVNFRGTKKLSNWYEHEWRALNEWLHEKKRTIKPLTRNYAYQASCVVTV